MKHSFLLATFVMGFYAVGCGEPAPDAVAEDLTRLCSGLTELEARHITDGFAHSRAMGEVIASAVHESATRAFLGSLASRSAPERQSALRVFAAEHGLSNYECPVLLE